MISIFKKVIALIGLLPFDSERKHIDNAPTHMQTRARKTRLNIRMRFSAFMFVSSLLFLAWILQYGHGQMLINIILAINGKG